MATLVPLSPNDTLDGAPGAADAPSGGAALIPLHADEPLDGASSERAIPRGMGGETGGRSYAGGPFSTPMPSATGGAWDSFWKNLTGSIPSMGTSFVDAQVAGGQGTDPDVAHSGYMKAPQSAQAMFDETGQVPDEKNMAALRDPQSGKYTVYYRNPDASEGRLTSAARAITSGLVAGGPPGAGAAISNAISPAINTGINVANRVGIGSGETKALGKISEAVAASEKGGGPGALDMTGQLVGGTGKQPVALADLSPELQALYGQAARVPGPGRTAATTFLENRDAGAGSRLSADVNEALGGNRTAFQTANDLSETQKTTAGPLYSAAFKANPNISSPVLDRILQTDAGKAALEGARSRINNRMQLMGKPDPELMEQAREAGQAIEGGKGVASGLKLSTWDVIKQEMDDTISATKRRVVNGTARPSEVRDLVSLKSQLVDQLDALDSTAKPARKGRGYGAAPIPAQPGLYAQARAAWSGPARMKDAIESGADLFKMQPEEIGQTIADLSPGERSAFRLGAESTIRRNIAQTGQAGDEARALLKNNYVQQQLRPIFGSQADFDKVISAAKNESMMAKTKYNVMGGSATAGRLAQDAGGEHSLMGPLAEAGAAFGAHEPILGAKAAYGFLQALKARATGMTPSVAEQIVSLLGDPSMSGDLSRAHAALSGPRRAQLPPSLLQPNPAGIMGLLGSPNSSQR